MIDCIHYDGSICRNIESNNYSKDNCEKCKYYERGDNNDKKSC